MRRGSISSTLTACLLGAIALTAAGLGSQNPKQPPTDNSSAHKDPNARSIQPQTIKSPADFEPTQPAASTPKNRAVPPRPSPEDPTVNPKSESDKANLPPLTFPSGSGSTTPIHKDRLDDSNPDKLVWEAYTVRQRYVLTFVLSGLVGLILGLALSFPVLRILNSKLWTKRPHRDLMRWEENADERAALRRIALAAARIAALNEVRQEVFTEPQEAALRRGFTLEISRLTDPEYALNRGYISQAELKRLRSSSLAISEMSFAPAIIGVAAAIAFGIDGWANGWTVGAIAAVIAFGFTLLGVERYHKYRSSYKTVVLGQFQERAIAKPDGQNGVRVVLVPPNEKPEKGETAQ